VFALELALAQTHATREDSADIQKAEQCLDPEGLRGQGAGHRLDRLLQGGRPVRPGPLPGLPPGRGHREAAKLLAEADVATWRDYLAFHKLNQYASLLPKAFADQRFEFNGKALSGTPQQSARWKRALGATNEAMDEAVGKIYVAKYFPAENKAQGAGRWWQYHRRLQPPHRQARLDGAGHPRPGPGQGEVAVRRRRLSGQMEILRRPAVVAGDAFGNAMRAEEFHYKQELAKLKRKPDRTEWAMPPQLVNAVNLPLQNALNFPAAILQPPFFDPKAPDAANYGAIGSIIGHEISHSFDDQGAQFDAQGRLRDWWTKEDLEHFKTASAKLVAQYNAYKPFPDLAVNGQLTLSENLADLAGLAGVLRCLQDTPAAKARGGATASSSPALPRAGAPRRAKPRCAAAS
jgi:putative endopeptidase